MPARREGLSAVDLAQAAHAGLMVDCYLPETNDEGKARRELFERAWEAARNAQPLFKLAFDRWRSSLDPTAACKPLRVAGRLATGLGAATTFEIGLTLHHTYGTPVIPGSSLKGLAYSYCHQVWGERDSSFRIGDPSGKHRALFGSTDDSGCLVFHDAWITPDSLLDDKRHALALDVMTPHHGDYYMKGGAQHPPADTDDPVPVTFLSVTGIFLVAVSCPAGTPDQQEQRKEWAALGLKLLEEAAGDWGAGAKTSSGYGRMYV